MYAFVTGLRIPEIQLMDTVLYLAHFSIDSTRKNYVMNRPYWHGMYIVCSGKWDEDNNWKGFYHPGFFLFDVIIKIGSRYKRYTKGS